MEKVTQEEMHKVFSDHLKILKEDFKYWADDYGNTLLLVTDKSGLK